MKRFAIAGAITIAVLGFSAGAAGATVTAAPPVVRIGDAVQVGEGAVLTPPAAGDATPAGNAAPSGSSSSGALETPLGVLLVLFAIAAAGVGIHRIVRSREIAFPPLLAPIKLPAEPELILVVDDEPAFRRSIARMLTESGYTVQEADDGAHALDAINAGLRPSLVLTDVAMSGVSGTELSDQLEKEHGMSNTVLMSGRDLATESPRFLRKPFQEGELLSLVRRELVGAVA